MRRRQLSVGILLAALLTGALGQVLAAAVCPHVRQDHACCHARVKPGHAAHEMPDGMQMPVAPATFQRGDTVDSDSPIEGCDHCMGRPSRSPQTAALREVERTNRGSEFVTPVTESRPSRLAPSFTEPVPTREHGPPKAPADRHVLISVFRI